MNWEKLKKSWWWLVPALFSALIYANSLRGGFFWDDRGLILDNPLVKTWKGSFSTFMPDYWLRVHVGTKGQYRPLRNLTLTADYALWEDSPGGYHVTNYALNIGVTVLSCVFAKEVLGTELAAAAAGLLFASHPAHAESVNYIKNRSDMLALGLMLLAFILFCRGRTLFSLVVYAVSLTAKEFSVALPFVMAAWVLLSGKEGGWRERAMRLWPYFALSGAFLLFKLTALRPPPELLFADPVAEGTNRLLLFLSTYAEYLWLIAAPFSFRVDRELHLLSSPLEWRVLGLAAAAAALFYLARRSPDRRRYAFAAFWLFFFIGPVSNILPIAGRLFAEQRAYIPSLGWALVLGLLVADFYSRPAYRKAAVAAAAAVVLVSGFSVMNRNVLWRSEADMWRRAVADNPSNLRALENLGDSLLRAGRLQEAEKVYLVVAQKYPGGDEVYINLGVISQAKGEIKAAIGWFEKALEVSPSNPEAYVNLGTMHMLSGDRGKARDYYLKAIDLRPDDPSALTNLGIVLASERRFREAASAFKRALAVKPDLIETRLNLAAVYREMGLDYEAGEELREAGLRKGSAGSVGFSQPVILRNKP